MLNYDIYKELEYLEKYLAQDGQTGLVVSLKDAVSCGSTGTEIFMHVRYILKKFIKANCTINPSTQRKVKEIVEYLDRILDS